MSSSLIDPRIALAIAAVAPDVDAAKWAAALNAPMSHYGLLSNDKRLAMFVGQVAAESGFKTLVEDLRYSTAERLHAVWPSRFPTTESAQPYVDNPEKLANLVYAGRMGNGDEASGDGWRFRGAGLIQLTGRSMYAAFGVTVGKTAEDVAPLVQTVDGAAASACWYWSQGRLNGIADSWNIEGATLIINGGTTGLAHREALCNAALAAITPQAGQATAGQDITARLNAEEAAISPSNPAPPGGVTA